MKKITVSIFIIFFYCGIVRSQMCIRIISIPEYFTPLLDTIHLAGDFNGWNPGDPLYEFIRQDDDSYTVNISGVENDTIKCKCTRGDWTRVETNEDGAFLPDREIIYHAGDTVDIEVGNWQDQIGDHTISGNVIMLDYNFYIPQLNRFRRIWIYLPPDYFTTTDYYPVIYMHDGQNVFDDATSFVGEWGIDESVEELIMSGHTKAIVVGIANGELDRIDEYSPWVNATYGGGEGDLYAQFIINTLKPYLDSNYRTLPDRENTAIGGSSLGGLISYYIALEYDSVFAKAIVFSPSFWFSSEVQNYAESFEKEFHSKIYIMADDTESGTIVSEINDVVTALQDAGFGEDEIISVIRTDGAHSEWFWEREYDEAYLWLFEDIIPLHVNAVQYELEIWFDANAMMIYLSSLERVHYRIINIAGQVISDGTAYGSIKLEGLASGIYFVEISDGNISIIEKIIAR